MSADPPRRARPGRAPGDGGAGRRPPIIHVSLAVADLGHARAFYEGILGCPVGRV
jgi:hypothetical protein